jgi:hypothetical protein
MQAGFKFSGYRRSQKPTFEFTVYRKGEKPMSIPPPGPQQIVLQNFPSLADEGPDPHQAYQKLFHQSPLPLGLTIEEAVGAQKERLRDFFDYKVESPMGILYKQWAFDGKRLKEFSNLSIQNRNHLKSCEQQLSGQAAEKCAVLAYAVRDLVQNVFSNEQRASFYRKLFSQPGYFNRESFQYQGNYGTQRNHDPLFNPLRLFDAVYDTYNSPHHLYSVEPSDRDTPSTDIGKFGTQEAFPFIHMDSSRPNADIQEIQRWLATEREDKDAKIKGGCLPVTYVYSHEYAEQKGPFVESDDSGSNLDTAVTWS